jgi:hypothetical protein
VGRGIGKSQRRILDELASVEDGHLSVRALADRIGVSHGQIRRAVHALADRELVVLVKEPGGWAGIGKYGPLVERFTGYLDENSGDRKDYGPEVPTAQVRHKLVDDFDDDGKPVWRHVKVEYVHAGMPTGLSLFVWTPEAHAEREARDAAFRAAFVCEYRYGTR